MVTSRSIGLAMAAMVLAGAGCRSGPPPEVPRIQWRTLRGLDVRTGRVPDEIKKLDRTVVKIAGYMVGHHEDTGYQMKEFLLVPYPNVSSDYPPPPANEIVLVKMAGGGTIDYSPNPIWIEGRFTIAPVRSRWGAVTYQLSATAAEPYKE